MRFAWPFRKKRSPARLYVIEDGVRTEETAPDRITATGRRGRAADIARRRILMCSVVFAAIFGLMGLRLFSVALGSGDIRVARVTAAGDDANRREIVDRHGVLLAANLPLRALEIAGNEAWDAGETAVKIAAIVPGVDAADLEGKIADKRYVEIREKLTPEQERAVFELGLPGVRFTPRIERFYPQGATAAHVIGHLEPGKGGVMGLEKVLNGRDGDGPLAASIDIRAQEIVEQELAAAMKKFHAKAAMGAVMDVETGEILALASLPDFDPNRPGAAKPDWRRNRTVYDRYELGSALKLLTAAAALDAGTATESSTYDARGAYKVADKTIRDFHGENRVLTFSEVIQHSSNIGAARMAKDLGTENLKMALKRTGLLDALPIELAERREPEPPWQWGPVETATISYGHGLSITPLHLLAATASIVNGGDWRAPTFLKQDALVEGRQVFKPETSETMRRIMREVITSGTASLAETPGYFSIGKTATAEKSSRGGYDPNARIATFVGAFPGFAPRYAVIVTLDEPQAVEGTFGYATAGWNAAPAYAAIVLRLAPALGLMPSSAENAEAAFARASTARRAALDAANAGGLQ
ncbi:MAG: penicillin-binding protein 2 [Parvularculaceae bacterium]|nr:penicillin-binding protein 2 [Parvularculaceae bacterium]